MKECENADRERFPELIDTLIEAVDGQDFTASLNPETGLGNIFCGDGPGTDRFVCEALDTPRGKAARKLFAKWQQKIDELVPEIGNIESLLSAIENAAELVPLAVGFAAGLRAAGVSKREAHTMLSGYLRHFRKE